jgi:hypothetical protein
MQFRTHSNFVIKCFMLLHFFHQRHCYLLYRSSLLIFVSVRNQFHYEYMSNPDNQNSYPCFLCINPFLQLLRTIYYTFIAIFHVLHFCSDFVDVFLDFFSYLNERCRTLEKCKSCQERNDSTMEKAANIIKSKELHSHGSGPFTRW